MVAEHKSPAGASPEERNPESLVKLERLLARHREEAARLREQFGDPEASFSAFVRETYDQESISEVFRDLLDGGGMWDADDVTNER